MSFLAPFFLLGATAIALPVLFHLIRRSPRVQHLFSSLMFLKPSPPRFTRRNRLEHLLLLLLRCAVLGLLALAFARPFLNRPLPTISPTPSAGQFIVLLDTSASMQRDGLWTTALTRLETFLADREPQDQVAVYAFDQSVQPVVRFDEWNAEAAGNRRALVLARTATLKPSWYRTDIDQAVIHAAEEMAALEASEPEMTRTILLITDLQEGSRLNDLQGYDWPQGLAVQTDQILAANPDNASLQWLASSDSTGERTVRLRVSNAADSRVEQFRVGWSSQVNESFSGKAVEVYVPAGQSRVVSLSPLNTPLAQPRVRLEGDAAGFDNEVFVVPPVQHQVTVLYFGLDDPADRRQPLYFLERAFPDTPARRISVVAVPGETAVVPEDTMSAALLVVTDSLNEATLDAVQRALTEGTTVLFAPRDVTAAPTLARLTGLESIQMTERRPAQYALLGRLDFRHPLMAPFADARFSDFTGIHFWTYRQLDPQAFPDGHVVARFDNNDPALIDVSVGAGRLFVLTSLWHPDDSQLALSTKFVPLLFSMLELTGKGAPTATRLNAGDTILLPDTGTDDGRVSVLVPDQDRLEWTPATEPSPVLTQPGHYTVEMNQQSFQLVANLDPAEARTSPLPADELERLGAPIAAAVVPQPVQLREQVTRHHRELESQQKLWRWIIAATLAVLLVEIWLAGRTARRSIPTEGVAV